MRLKDGIDKNIRNFSYIDKNTITTPFFTKEYCDYLIDKLEEVEWKIDPYGNCENNLQKIKDGQTACKDYFDVIKEKIEPEIIKNWSYAFRECRLWQYYPDPFAKKYTLQGQTDLKKHVDSTLLTFLIKLNDNFGGCNTILPRQNWDTGKLNVGGMVIFPGTITPHYVEKLKWGSKYSLIGRISRLQCDVREG